MWVIKAKLWLDSRIRFKDSINLHVTTLSELYFTFSSSTFRSSISVRTTGNINRKCCLLYVKVTDNAGCCVRIPLSQNDYSLPFNWTAMCRKCLWEVLISSKLRRISTKKKVGYPLTNFYFFNKQLMPSKILHY